MNTKEFNSLIDSAWAEFQKVKGMTCVVPDSVPILWFGDVEAYDKSNPRIVTVGLNPSHVEFEDGSIRGTAARFPTASPLVIKTKLTSSDIDVYKAAMNEYFCTNPYTKWFDRNEKLLNLLDASYYKCKGGSTAIHIDACTPVATDPTWGRLCAREKKILTTPSLFSTLMNVLNPDIVLISVNQQIVRNIFDSNGWHLHSTTTVPYVKSKRYENRVIIWGYNYRGTPFGRMTDYDIEKIFKDIRKKYSI